MLTRRFLFSWNGREQKTVKVAIKIAILPRPRGSSRWGVCPSVVAGACSDMLWEREHSQYTDDLNNNCYVLWIRDSRLDNVHSWVTTRTCSTNILNSLGELSSRVTIKPFTDLTVLLYSDGGRKGPSHIEFTKNKHKYYHSNRIQECMKMGES